MWTKTNHLDYMYNRFIGNSKGLDEAYLEVAHFLCAAILAHDSDDMTSSSAILDLIQKEIPGTQTDFKIKDEVLLLCQGLIDATDFKTRQSLTYEDVAGVLNKDISRVRLNFESTTNELISFAKTVSNLFNG